MKFKTIADAISKLTKGLVGKAKELQVKWIHFHIRRGIIKIG